MDERDGLNERIYGQVEARAELLIFAGALPEDAAVQAVEEFLDSWEEQSEGIANRLAKATSDHLDSLADYHAGFDQRLLDTYGEAFAAYDTVVEVISEAALDFWHRYTEESETDELTELLWGNLAQCLRVAREVGHLLRGGFPIGALAAQRTAYELAVRSSVLKAYGREPGHMDLAERYRLHDFIGQEADVREYMKHAETLGFEPMDEDEADAAAERRRALIERFGNKFRAQYGWAVGLPGVAAGNFAEVEELAGVSHRRGFYRWSSHYVHGDPSALRMSIMRRGGVSQGVLSNRTNRFFTDPAQFTLYALQRVCCTDG